jgi:hypothetical protein
MTLHEILRPERPTAVVDVGSAAIDGPPPYSAMLERGLCTVIGFDPQRLLCRKDKPGVETYLPYVIGDGSPGILRVCAVPGMTSMFPPDDEALGLFPGFRKWGKVLHEAAVTTRRLDDISEVGVIDFLKVDAQGSELAVIRGAHKKLAGAVFVQAEVAFVALYHGQPMFRDVDEALTRLGFMFHTFADIGRRMVLPYPCLDGYQALNQIQGADAVYVRDFRDLGTVPDEALKRMALIAHHCFGSFDLAFRCVDRLAARHLVPPDAAADYLNTCQRAIDG